MTEPASTSRPHAKQTGVVWRFGVRALLAVTTRYAVLFPRKQTGVPRRFGVAALLVIVTMYAVLFAAMQTVQTLVHQRDPLLFVMVAIFVTGVGLSQAVFFKGHNPRKASVLTGIVLAAPMTLVALLRRPLIDRSAFIEALVVVFCYVLSGFGALAGYLVGGAIAGVFLLLNKVQPPLDDPEDEGPAARKNSQDRLASEGGSGAGDGPASVASWALPEGRVAERKPSK
jgi:hypothetical protein